MKVCDNCKAADAVVEYRYPDDSTTDLCYECAMKAGFCVGCGWFSAGVESFDFSPVKGYCYDCVRELEAELAGDGENYDGDWEY